MSLHIDKKALQTQMAQRYQDLTASKDHQEIELVVAKLDACELFCHEPEKGHRPIFRNELENPYKATS